MSVEHKAATRFSKEQLDQAVTEIEKLDSRKFSTLEFAVQTVLKLNFPRLWIQEGLGINFPSALCLLDGKHLDISEWGNQCCVKRLISLIKDISKDPFWTS